MLKKVIDGLDAVSIISWIMTIIVLVCIWVLEMNDISVKLAWNDISRICDGDTMTIKLFQLMTGLVILAGTTTIFSTSIRKVESKKEIEES